MYWLPYSSHTSHHPSQTPCLSWISYATQKLMILDSCKMLQKQSKVFHTFLWHFFQVLNRILFHIILVKCPLVQIVFLKFTSCDNQALVGYSNCCCSCSYEPEIIKIGQSSHKIYSNNTLNFQESPTIWMPVQKMSGNLLHALRIYIYIYTRACVCVRGSFEKLYASSRKKSKVKNFILAIHNHFF